MSPTAGTIPEDLSKLLDEMYSEPKPIFKGDHMENETKAPQTTAPTELKSILPFIKAMCDSHRKELKTIEDDVRKMVADPNGLPTGEAKAQAMLAVRHLEDARMRLGKVIQYSDDGVSVYDK